MKKNYYLQITIAILASVFPLKSFSQCTPSGDQISYGNGQWIGYVYSNINAGTVPADNFSDNYKGFLTQPDDFELFVGGGSISGPDLCGTYDENFAIRFKMKKTWTAGYYTFYVGADDGYRISFDGGATWIAEISDWADHGFTTKAATFYMEGEKNMVIEYYEHGGSSRMTFDFFTATCTSTAPTGINGNTVVSCNQGTTLTATGGINAIGTYYQWGTGSIIGQNIIPNATQEQITVHPSENTTYWVRRVVGGPCDDYTTGVTVEVTVGSAPAGDPSVFGDNIWHVYGFNNVASLTPALGFYSGYYTQDSLGFDTSGGQNSWPRNASPSNSADWHGCAMDIDNFSFQHKRKGFPCGKYTLVMGNWDDDSRLYVNGQQVWQANGWSGGQANSMVGTFDLDENSTIELRTLEGGGDANAQLIITEVLPTAPTSISGTTTVCSGAQTTLTAVGGSTGTGYAYQWGTGTPGSNIIAGETSASITVTPTEDTTYWVRVQGDACGGKYSTAATTNVTTTASGAGHLISASSFTCKDAIPADIDLTGSTGNVVKWQYAGNAAFTQGVTDIANTTTSLTGAQIGSITATRYFRAIVDGGSCGNVATPVFTLMVSAPVTWNGSWSSTPTATSSIVVESNLSLNSDLEVCSCEVKNNAILAVSPGSTLTVKGKVTVAPTANLLLFNKGALVQIDDVANQGNIEVRRNSSKVKRLDYTLWSSPVQGQQLLAFSPFTLTNRFYEYSTTANGYVSVSPNDNFETGKGYLIRTPNNHPVPPTAQEVAFKGVPNNGTITTQLSYVSAALSYNGVGNPYASPIKVADFIDANANTIEGTLWFWRKTNDNNESRSYSTVTKFGYSANGAAGGENDFAIDPNGVINTGQGFIVKAKNAGQLVFNNSMRKGNSTDQFFRNSNQTSRIWLNVTKGGAFSQTMLGYIAGVTNGYDDGYDGLALMDGNLNLYTIAGGMNLAIQARPDFSTADIVPLGFKSTTAGTFSFAIDHVDGLFTGNAQAVYIKDNQLSLTHNLKESSYTFISDAGTFDSRFEVVYVPMETMGTNNPEGASKTVVVYASRNQVNIIASDEIRSVVVYDLLGREVFSKTAIAKENYSTPALQAAQILAVKVTMADGSIATKKIQMN